MCHQGTISSASTAALPQLADIAETAASGDWALDLAGAVAGGLLQDHHGADEEVARQEPTLARLRDLATARLAPGQDSRSNTGPAPTGPDLTAWHREVSAVGSFAPGR
ncbi:hypothetical protein [Kitasatospora sp. NPDC085464]|uniref:hypothetical protein n=1 Tax=Kitasatospora sp. NPDC085464 TaxID=3364063 RepID=UPI0037C83EEC